MPYRDQPPVLLALIGDSGTGKSTLSAGILETLGEARVNDLCLDDYHRYDRAQRSELGITALHPDCNYLSLMRQHLMLVRRGEPIFKPVYDHATGTFGHPEHLTPRQVVVVHGLLGLYDDPLKSCYHVSVFLDPDPELRIQWKIQRDTSKRGYSVDAVRRQLAHRQPDVEKYIMPQRSRADMIVRFYPQPGYWATRDNSALNVRVLLRTELPACFSPSELGPAAQWIKVEESQEFSHAVEVDIDGSIPDKVALEIEEKMWAEMERVRHLRPDVIGCFQQGDEIKRSRTLALTQLLITYYCIQAAELELENLSNAMATG